MRSQLRNVTTGGAHMVQRVSAETTVVVSVVIT